VGSPDLRPLLPVHEEVEFLAHNAMTDWLLEETKSARTVAGGMMDTAPTVDDLERARRAHAQAYAAEAGWCSGQNSTAVRHLVYAWDAMGLYDDPVREMRTRMLALLNPIDAMAYLAREEAAGD
jgi:hypothetical protein